MAEWMKGAVKPAHKGLFGKKAEKAGMSTSKFAAKEKGAPGALGKEARLAQTFAKFRKTKPTLAAHIAKLRLKGAFGKSRAA